MSKKQIAFTLIELLVVIAIIGILSGLIVVSMGGMTQKATIAKAQVFSNSLRNSLMLNLVSEWKLDSNTNDSWNGGNNGTAVVATSTTSGCVQGTCYNFNGNGYVEIPYNANTRTAKVTFAGWGYMENWATANDVRIISCTEVGGYNITIYTGYADAFIYANSQYTRPTFYSSVPSSGWHYFVGSFDGRYAKVYFDGALADTHDYVTIYPLAYSYANSLLIGAEAGAGTGSAGNGYFTGRIDEVRIYNEGVTASQIKEQYYLGLSSLLTNKQITSEEYLSRIKDVSKK